jgi:CRISPR/Cas system CSM-associated protein Csm2 small subunit
MENKIEVLKQEIQQVIDLMAAKQIQRAIEKHADASDFLDELIDHADDDETVIELSKYQVLLNHLHQKIHNP